MNSGFFKNTFAAIIIAASFFAGIYMVMNDDLRHSSSISVQAEGKAKAVPDTVIISANANVNGIKTRELAMSGITTAIAQMNQILKNANIEPSKIQTNHLDVSEDYYWEDARRVDNGFRAFQSTTIRLEKVAPEMVNNILSQLSVVENLQVNMSSAVILDTDAVYNEARQKALEKARQKAEQIATANGMKIIKLENFSESAGTNYPMPLYDMANMAVGAREKSVSVPAVETSLGENEYSVSVTASYQMK